MASRLELQVKLEQLLGSRKVYYQPPEGFKISYPAIIYSRDDIDLTHADNINYKSIKRYNVIVIDKLPDNEVIEKIFELPMSTFDRHYIADGLNHDSITLYY